MQNKDSWADIRHKVFPPLNGKRRIIISKRRPDFLEDDAIYIHFRPSEFKMRKIGNRRIEKNFVEIYSGKDFVFPELGNLHELADLIDEYDCGEGCRAFYSLDEKNGFLGTNLLIRELVRDNGGKVEYQSR